MIKKFLTILTLISCSYPVAPYHTTNGVGLYSRVTQATQDRIDEILTYVCDCAHIGTRDCYSLFDIRIKSLKTISNAGPCQYYGFEECVGHADIERGEIWITQDLSGLAHEAGHFYEMVRNGRMMAGSHRDCSVAMYCEKMLYQGAEDPDIDDCVESKEENE